ncbi:hypothetical protein JXR01_02540 [Candidatus Kaiserbacteria bacterium]|nr:MAG: hypothetical protein JXR01_02540 [Candidatus Kaiserbacteria bacterium]
MLYVYYGKDVDAARAKVQATVASMLAKSPDALYFRITVDDVHGYNFDELTGSQALFKNEYVVVLDTLFSTKEGEEIVLQNLEKIAEAPHPFFVLDAALTAPIKKKLEKHAVKTHEFKETVPTKKPTFNTFSLTDALGERNVKKLWSLFREAKNSGVSDEEIHGILFWMLKSLVLASSAKTPDEVGMKPYPFTKAKSSLKNFSSVEVVEGHLKALALLPQHARRNGVALEIELERFILTL